MFVNRSDAGRRLAARLARYRPDHPVVLGLPRGGVVVASEIARALDAPLDVLVVRKLQAPGQPELGVGAVTDGDDPQTVLNPDVVRMLDVSDAYLRDEVVRQLAEVRRRQALFRGGRPPVELRDRTVIVADDGIATGGTVRAALRALRRSRPRRIVLAVGVAPPETIAGLQDDADVVVCLEKPAEFHSVGRFYEDFRQTTDDEVIELLVRAAKPTSLRPTSAPRADEP